MAWGFREPASGGSSRPVEAALTKEKYNHFLNIYIRAVHIDT